MNREPGCSSGCCLAFIQTRSCVHNKSYHGGLLTSAC
jgi:hypothetical protein